LQIYEIGLVVNRIVCGLSAWLAQLTARAHQNIAIVALANKLARMAWAVVAKNEDYQAPLIAGIPSDRLDRPSDDAWNNRGLEIVARFPHPARPAATRFSISCQVCWRRKGSTTG
jgi:hypothetical protein